MDLVQKSSQVMKQSAPPEPRRYTWKPWDKQSMLEELKVATDEKFDAFITLLRNSPETYLAQYFSGITSMPGLPFTECSCDRSNTHNRFTPGNTRTRMENFLSERTEQLAMSTKTAGCFSVGSGNLLPELLLLSRLVKQGFTTIRLVMLDPEYSSPERTEATCDALRFIANRMQGLYGIKIDLQFHGKFNDVKPDDSFDVVYAVDYEALCISDDFSSRQLPGRSESTRKTMREFQWRMDDKIETHYSYQEPKVYQAAIDFIKALTLLKPDPMSCAAISTRKDMITYGNNRERFVNEDHATLTELFSGQAQQPTFDTIYIYSNITTLIYNLDFLSSHKESALLINTVLVNDEDKPWVDELLKKNGIQHSYVSEADAVKHFTTPKPNSKIPEKYGLQNSSMSEATPVNYLTAQKSNSKILIVDYSIYDSSKNEDILPNQFVFDDKQVFIVRIDLVLAAKLHRAGDMTSKATFIYPKLE